MPFELTDEEKWAWQIASDKDAPPDWLLDNLATALHKTLARAMKAEWEILSLIGPYDPTPRTWTIDDWLATAEQKLMGK